MPGHTTLSCRLAGLSMCLPVKVASPHAVCDSIGINRRCEMKNKSKWHKCASRQILFYICIFGWAITFGLARPSSGREVEMSSSPKGSPIRLVLRTSKKFYRVGDAVAVTVLLENETPDKVYYVGRALFQGDIPTPFHYVNFALSDNTGKPISLFDGASVEDLVVRYGLDKKPIPPMRPTINELLIREYIQLSPRAVYGFRTELYKPGSKPGVYWLNATYYETEALNRARTELKDLPVPIWAQRLVSNTVKITVIP